MAIPTKDLKGITDAIESALKEQGIKDSDQLLEAAATPKQRKELATAVGAAPRAVLELANRADLSRVKGVAGVYSDLLEQAGVDTVKELATRRPDNLYKKIIETNESAGLTRQPPKESDVESWVAQAKDLLKILEY